MYIETDYYVEQESKTFKTRDFSAIKINELSRIFINIRVGEKSGKGIESYLRLHANQPGYCLASIIINGSRLDFVKNNWQEIQEIAAMLEGEINLTALTKLFLQKEKIMRLLNEFVLL